ncbi:hypothetical protein SNEBB_006293 [Seison nebaliae]|nr:hypothetical protein SNEBB_006293 [Seison nebaliae]
MIPLLKNHLPHYSLLIIHILLNVVIFCIIFYQYFQFDKYFYLREITGWTIALSRAAAGCINFNCFLILLPICRTINSILRNFFLKRINIFCRMIDNSIDYHIILAYTLIFWSILHILGHIFNLEHLIVAWNYQEQQKWNNGSMTESDRPLIRFLMGLTNDNSVDPFQKRHVGISSYVLYTCAPGWTGIGMVIILTIMFFSAQSFVRKIFFKTFFRLHYLFLPFLILLCFHGIGELVRYQTNVKVHDPNYCSSRINEWTESEGKCPLPTFEGTKPASYKWIIFPLIIFFIELLIRFIRLWEKVDVVETMIHSSNVVELRLRKYSLIDEYGHNMKYAVGQYVSILIPNISKFEWHPFTITSSPSNDTFFSLHIRAVGDWTNALKEMVEEMNTVTAICTVNNMTENEVDRNIQHKLWDRNYKIRVNGPFGAPAQDYFLYDVAILIGAGIGVTPYASVLSDLQFQLSKRLTNENPNKKWSFDRLKHIHFYWLCPQIKDFSWFSQIFEQLDKSQMKMYSPQKQNESLSDSIGTLLINNRIHLTRPLNPDQIKSTIDNYSNFVDNFTKLHLTKTYFGRPNFSQLILQINERYRDKYSRIGLFCCGPPTLSASLKKLCNEMNHLNSKLSIHSTLYYNEEKF